MFVGGEMSIISLRVNIFCATLINVNDNYDCEQHL